MSHGLHLLATLGLLPGRCPRHARRRTSGRHPSCAPAALALLLLVSVGLAAEPVAGKAAAETPLFKPATALGNEVVNDMKAQWLSIDRWFVLGPLAADGQAEYAPRDENAWPTPETADLNQAVTGMGGKTVRWKYLRVTAAAPDDGRFIAPPVEDAAASAVWCFVGLVWSHADMDVIASFSAADFGAVWLNGKQVYDSGKAPRPNVPFTASSLRVVSLRTGANWFFVRLRNAKGVTGFSACLMTRSDRELIGFLAEESPAAVMTVPAAATGSATPAGGKTDTAPAPQSGRIADLLPHTRPTAPATRSARAPAVDAASRPTPTSVLTETRGIAVTLAPAVFARAGVRPDSVITITKEGDTFLHDGVKNVNQGPVKQGELMQWLKGRAMQTPPPVVRLEIDKDAAFAKVLPVVDLLSFYGLKDIEFGTAGSPLKER